MNVNCVVKMCINTNDSDWLKKTEINWANYSVFIFLLFLECQSQFLLFTKKTRKCIKYARNFYITDSLKNTTLNFNVFYFLCS